MVNETADMMNGKLNFATEEVTRVREDMQVLQEIIRLAKNGSVVDYISTFVRE